MSYKTKATIAGAIVAFFLIPGCLSAAETKTYSQMVDELKKGSTSVDYSTLRAAYAKSPGYDPYDVKIKSALDAMLKNQDCAAALDQARKIQDLSYTNIDGHMMVAFCAIKSGDKKAAEPELAIARGLMHSILSTGNGQSPATAIKVVTISEEYSVLRGNRLKLQRQSTIEEGGHRYDRVEATGALNVPRLLFFNIDLPYESLKNTTQNETKGNAATPPKNAQ